MVNTLVIGDLHFDNKPVGMLDAQKAAIVKICRNHEFDKVIFLGDLMMHRNPRPSVLLALKDMLDDIVHLGYEVFILRGNHDSVNKSDDGHTALSLFEGPRVRVITQTWHDHENKWTFIPHYEDEEKIKQDLNNTP